MFYQFKKGKLINDGKPIYLATTGKKLFKLSDWWQYEDSTERRIVVPKSFICDLASVPTFVFWWQYGAFNTAAICHDWAYIFGYILIAEEDKLRELKLTKEEADRLFADINFTLEVPNWVNRLMYCAVRIFGSNYGASKHQYGKSLSELKKDFFEAKSS